MGGAQPLAATLAGAVSLNVECQQTSIDFRLRTRYLDLQARDLDDALRLVRQHCASRQPVSIGLLGNAAEVLPELVRRAKAGGMRPDLVTDQTSAHDLINGYLPIGWTVPQWKAAQADPSAHARLGAEAGRSCAVHVQAMLDFQALGIPVVDYGNNIRQVARENGVANAFDFPGFVPAYIRPLFCQGKGPFRWAALSGDPEDIYRTDAKIKELFPENRHVHRWLEMARERISFQGLPARICWLGLGERHKAGLAFNEMVRTGELKAPIVIGRDHLDCGSVASPNRETEAMRDGTDAVSDWPLLNGLLSMRRRSHLGLPAPWRRRGHGLLPARRPGHRRRRHRRRRPAPGAGALERSRHRRHAPRRRRLRARPGLRPRERPEPAHAGLSGRFATLTSTLMEAASAAEKVRGPARAGGFHHALPAGQGPHPAAHP